MTVRFEYNSSHDINDFNSDSNKEFEEDWKLIEKLLLKDDETDIDLTVGSDPYLAFKWP